MKLKNSVINKLSKMSKEELFELINNLCDSNDEVVSYLNAGAVAVGVGRDFYQGFTPREITNRTKEILNEVRDFSEWNKKSI